MSKCRNCEQGPAGIDGHQDLYAHSLDARHIQFRCRTCNAVWERKVGNFGQLDWTTPSGQESAGFALPNRQINA